MLRLMLSSVQLQQVILAVLDSRRDITLSSAVLSGISFVLLRALRTVLAAETVTLSMESAGMEEKHGCQTEEPRQNGVAANSRLVMSIGRIASVIFLSQRTNQIQSITARLQIHGQG
jgi:hypothetical protein